MLTNGVVPVDNKGMARTTQRTKEIRSFLIESITDHPKDIAALAGQRFGISRQAVSRHLKALVDRGLVVATGNTRRRTYSLVVLSTERVHASVSGLEEDVLWRNQVVPLLGELPQNVFDVWQYGFTEMVNNVIDHSGSADLHVTVQSTALSIIMLILDDGVGIFRKIQRDLGLEDERHAVLELAKGKLTTDPEHHTGEGIFFSSRMFDDYAILSGGVHFSHHTGEEEDWIFELENPAEGTAVYMALRKDSPRSTNEVFDKYTSKNGDYGFNRTVVPVRMLRHGPERLVSRSQAKRLLARVDRFRVVVLDFTDVEVIGQAFADEIFRVFARSNPRVKIIPINMGTDVKKMVRRAKQTGTLLP